MYDRLCHARVSDLLRGVRPQPLTGDMIQMIDDLAAREPAQ